MGESNNTVSGIFGDETQERGLEVTTDSLEYMKDLRNHKYVNDKDENVEDRLKNKQLRKKIADLDHSLRIQNNLTFHLQQKNEELDRETDKILWAQNRARLTLASQTNFQFGINQTMDQYVAYMGNKADSSDKIFKRKQVVIEKIYSMKTTLQERKKEIEQNEFHATKIKQENLITRKRNQAMLIRLGRQHQEAKFQHQQILDKLTSLRDRLKKNATNIEREKLHD